MRPGHFSFAFCARVTVSLRLGHSSNSLDPDKASRSSPVHRKTTSGSPRKKGRLSPEVVWIYSMRRHPDSIPRPNPLCSPSPNLRRRPRRSIAPPGWRSSTTRNARPSNTAPTRPMRRRRVAGDRRGGFRQDQYAGASRRESGGEGRGSAPHPAADLFAPRRARNDPPRHAHRRRGARHARRAGARADVVGHVSQRRRAAVARIRRADRPRTRLHDQRPRGFRRSDESRAPRTRFVGERAAFSGQGHLLCHLFARREYGRVAQPTCSTTRFRGAASGRPICACCSRLTSTPSRSRACSTTTTCCSTGRIWPPSRRSPPICRRASITCWSTSIRTPTACRRRSCSR